MQFLLDSVHWSEITKNIVETAAFIIGGVWVYWRFFLNREDESKLELDLEIKVIAVSDQGEYIVELTASLTNKGLVRHHVEDFNFDLFYLLKTDNLNHGPDVIDNELEYLHHIKKGQPWVSKDWYQAFVDAGVTRKFNYITFLPKNTLSALFITRFNQPQTKKVLNKNQGQHRILRAVAQKSIRLEPA
jgi:hypothetical protein